VDDSGPLRDGLSAGEFSVAADEVTCQQFVELVTGYFEGALAPGTLSHVEEHLVMCDWCVTYLEQMKATIAAVGALGETSTPEPSEELMSALRAKQGGGR
jgi:predicted anti-sigma-YlaC factor YlaD